MIFLLGLLSIAPKFCRHTMQLEDWSFRKGRCRRWTTRFWLWTVISSCQHLRQRFDHLDLKQTACYFQVWYIVASSEQLFIVMFLDPLVLTSQVGFIQWNTRIHLSYLTLCFFPSLIIRHKGIRRFDSLWTLQVDFLDCPTFGSHLSSNMLWIIELLQLDPFKENHYP